MIRFFTIIALITASTSFAQYDMGEASDTTDQKEEKIDKYELKKHIYVGGELSLSFGNQLYLYLGPLAGYEIWGGISAGVQAMYQLNRFTLTNGASISSHAYGGGIFARWRPPTFPYVLLQTEFNAYNVEDLNTVSNNPPRTTVPAFMGGVGYAGGFDKFYYHVLLMYDFIDNDLMPLPRFFGGLPLYIRYGMVFYLG